MIVLRWIARLEEASDEVMVACVAAVMWFAVAVALFQLVRTSMFL